MVHDCQLWRPVCQGREVMTPCISPLWTKTGVLQKLLANGLHISLVTHTPRKLIELVRSLSDWIHIQLIKPSEGESWWNLHL